MIDAKRYPLDFEALQKGDVISVETLEDITRSKCGTSGYSLRVLGISQQIEQHTEMLGVPIITRIRKGRIELLSDEDAIVEIYHRHNRHEHGVGRNYHRQTLVDRTRLSDESQATHDRMLFIQQNAVKALRQSRKDSLKQIRDNGKRELLDQPKV